MGRCRWIIVLAATASLVACDSGGIATTDTSPESPAAGLVRRDFDIGGSETDIFLPGAVLSEDEAAAPVVVMLHGTAADRHLMEPLAMAVAETGALVYVPSWPVIDQVEPFPDDEGDGPFWRQSESVICMLRSVKQTAAELGGDPSDLTLVGHSGGGMIGARVAMVDDVPWPGIDCADDVDHRPNRFIGLAGDYEGVYQYAMTQSAAYAPYDVMALEPTNRDLDVWLMHGHNDDSVNLWSSALLADHLAEVGIESHLLTTDDGHAAPLDPSTPAGRFTADRIAAIVHDRPEPAWWPDGAVDATLRLGSDDTCVYEGPETWPTDRALTIQLENATTVAASFVLVSIRSDVEITRAEALAADGILGVDDPDWVDSGGFRPVPPGETRMLRFAFVEADQTFVVYCHIDNETTHPRAGWMFPAALLEAGPAG
jgi:predicted esterase